MMRLSYRTSRLVAVGAVMSLLSVPALAAHAAHSAPASPVHVAKQSSCAALGVYQVGPRILPMAPSSGGHPGVRPAPPARAGTGTAVIAWPAWLLRGTMVISSYTGCSTAASRTPTQGTFSVQRTAIGPPIERSSRSGTRITCYVPCWQPPLGIISATGTFVQDQAHADDPLYVTVSATITSTRAAPGPELGRPCAVDVCPGPTAVITSTESFSNVTGYLQVGAHGPQSATLSFLPPPVANMALVPTPMVLDGWMGPIKPWPATVPPPAR